MHVQVAQNVYLNFIDLYDSVMLAWCLWYKSVHFEEHNGSLDALAPTLSLVDQAEIWGSLEFPFIYLELFKVRVHRYSPTYIIKFS